MSFFTYILECSDGTYYVGHTDNLDHRMAQHGDGIGCKYTSQRRPLKLLWSVDFPSREAAFMAERQLKGWSRAKKEALMRGDFDALAVLARGRAGAKGASSSSA
jgi:predicted GIY-YIG superfamily endonuclease